MDELKPCPFCGGSGMVFREMDTGFQPPIIRWVVCCSMCAAEATRNEQKKERAIAAWNRRYKEDE